MMRRRLAAIVNPVSGRGGTASVVRATGSVLRRFGAKLRLFTTTRPGHAAEIARGISCDVDAILAVGGDGTVSEIVNGLEGSRIPILILGTGTENVLAKYLRMPRDPNGVADTLLNGQPRACDVNLVNGRKFLAVAGVGFDAECVLRVSLERRGHITHRDYFWPLWRTFWGHRFPRLRVSCDAEVVFEGRGLAILGGIPRYALGMRILEGAWIDDGRLDVCIFACSSRLGLMNHAARVLAGRHLASKDVVYRQAAQVRIESPDRVPIEADGDYAGFLPATFTIMPNAAWFLQPHHA